MQGAPEGDGAVEYVVGGYLDIGRLEGVRGRGGDG